jgi:LmbE family N-acetylglucosaminyl deacetylase
MDGAVGVCSDCGHRHAGEHLGWICVGCPCATRAERGGTGAPLSAERLAEYRADRLEQACAAVVAAVAELQVVGAFLLTSSEADALEAAARIADGLPFVDR